MSYAFEKPLLASKTFWVNLITTIVAVLTLIAGQEWIAEYPKVTAAIGVALGLLNIVLRIVTVDAVKVLAVLFMLSLGGLGVGESRAAAVDVVSVADGSFKLPLAPNKPPKVVPVSASQSPASPQAAPTACYVDSKGVRHCPGGQPAARGGAVKAFFGRLLKR